MTNDKVNEVLVQYAREFGALGHGPERTDVTRTEQTEAQVLRHAHWMCNEALSFGPERIEKKMRWLGFIQGVRFVTGVATIADVKRDNMPPGETFRA